jgi:antitoxin ChpS
MPNATPLKENTGLGADPRVEVDPRGGPVTLGPRRKPRYTLAELLARCDPEASVSEEESGWEADPSLGREIL